VHAPTRDVGHDALADEQAETLSEDRPRHADLPGKPFQSQRDFWRAMDSCKCPGHLWVSEAAKPTSGRSRVRRQERADRLNEHDVGDALSSFSAAPLVRDSVPRDTK
jgi:hypothetical protein